MKLQHFAAAAAALVTVSVAGGALAADAITVKLQQPVAEKAKLIVGGAVFNCEGDSCVAAAPSSRTFATSTCKDLAKKFGAVASFGDGRKQLEGDKLSTCNAAAGGAQVANR